MKRLLILFLLIICGFLSVSCSSKHEKQDLILRQSQHIYPAESRVKAEKQTFSNCGKISENRYFCFDLKRGTDVDKREQGQYLWYVMDLYLLDEEDKLIAKYDNAIIMCCDEVRMEEFLPYFENGKALISIVGSNTDKKSDIIKSKNIIDIYIDKNGNYHRAS